MYTKEELTRQLHAMLPSRTTVLMHSSCKSVGPLENGADTLLDALQDSFCDGLVVLPAHTWATVNPRQPVFDVLYSPVCVGILPELFRRRSGVSRSWHPTHSVAAWGADAEQFTAGDHLCPTPCARNSAWGRLYDRDAYVLMVGVELSCMTYFHGVEEWADVPGRVDMEHPQEYVVIPPAGGRLIGHYNRHIGSPSELFPKVESDLLRAGALKFARLGDATVRVVSCRKSADLLLPMLREQPELFGMARGKA